MTSHAESNSRFRIVARTNGVGIDRDVRLLSDGIERTRPRPVFSFYRSISPLRRLWDRRNESECLIFLERITSRWLRRAGRYVLIPNQERYPERLVPLLRHMEQIWCKSHHAVNVFKQHHSSVHFLGFTSVDRWLPDVAPDYTRFFHLAGGSNLKGTETLMALWAQHPEWPELTVVQHRENAPTAVPANVTLVTRYLDDAELQQLQNRCGIHLCPSRSEGWGHYIVEAMSCAAVVVTTDGPPMNELVSTERGVLAAYDRSEPRKLGINFFVDAGALEQAVSTLLTAPAADKERLGKAARGWFLENDRTFHTRLQRLMSGLTKDTQTVSTVR